MFIEVTGEELLEVIVSLRVRMGQLLNMAHECRYRGQNTTALTFEKSATRLLVLVGKLEGESAGVAASVQRVIAKDKAG